MKNYQNQKRIAKNKKAYQQVNEQVEKRFESGNLFIVIIEKQQKRVAVVSTRGPYVIDKVFVFAKYEVICFFERGKFNKLNKTAVF